MSSTTYQHFEDHTEKPCTMKERIFTQIHQISSTVWCYLCCGKKLTPPKDAEPEVIDLPRVNTTSSCEWLNWCKKYNKHKII